MSQKEIGMPTLGFPLLAGFHPPSTRTIFLIVLMGTVATIVRFNEPESPSDALPASSRTRQQSTSTNSPIYDHNREVYYFPQSRRDGYSVIEPPHRKAEIFEP